GHPSRVSPRVLARSPSEIRNGPRRRAVKDGDAWDGPRDILRNLSSVIASRNFSDLYSARITWGGWGSNPRPADYEEPVVTLRTRYLHGYYGVAPPITLIAPFAQVSGSTNRSTAK